MSRTSKLSWAVATTVVALTACVISAPAVVRRKVRERGLEQGVTTSVREVMWKDGKLRLRGVKADPVREGEGFTADLEEVAVEVSIDGSVDSIEVTGGAVAFSEGRDGKPGKAKGRGVPVRVRGLYFTWTGWDEKNSWVKAFGVDATRDEEGLRASAERVEVRARGSGAEAIKTEFEKRGRSITVKAKTVNATLERGTTEGGQKGPGSKDEKETWKVGVEVEEANVSIIGKKAQAKRARVKAEIGGTSLSLEGTAGQTSTDGLWMEEVAFSVAAKPGLREIEAKVAADSVSIEKRQLSAESADFKRVAVSARVRREERIEVRADLRVGPTSAALDGEWGPGEYWVHAAVQPPEAEGQKRRTEPVPCSAVMESVQGLAKDVSGIRMDGTFAMEVDVRAKDDDVQVEFKMDDKCKVVHVPEGLYAGRFKRRFERTVVAADGSERKETAGPGSEGWTAIGRISPFMIIAAMTTEDPGFRSHSGFDQGAISNSIRDNLKAGRFFRGASTISMQLAKNLWLDRTKNIRRKVSEAILTKNLEQNLGKDDIMELYLNVAEFAPGVYGIGRASKHYFKTSPDALSLSQCLFLSLMLPNPKEAPFEKDGKLRRSRASLIRTLEKSLLDRKQITEEEYAEASDEIVVFGRPRPVKESGKGHSADAKEWDADL